MSFNLSLEGVPMFNRIINLSLLILLVPLAAHAVEEKPANWSKKSISDLLNTKVTLASRAPESAFEVPAAMYVITRNDIERSGATSIPEVLRLAPGIQVARAGSSQWAISSRGFNDQFSNKLLILIDGRTVYTPIFSGVYWDTQDFPIDDIKQIEIIRGPGATLWGANAVNGIINIITEEAVNTEGNLVSTIAGNEDRGTTTARTGQKIGDNIFYRVYGKHTEKGPSKTVLGFDSYDNWKVSQGGFRLDWNKSATDLVTVQGDTYSGKEKHTLSYPSLTAPFSIRKNDDEEVGGGNLLSRFKHTTDTGSEFTAQTYIDYTSRNIEWLEQQYTTFDFDFQHSLPEFYRNELTWGAGYRSVWDDLDGKKFLQEGVFLAKYNPTQQNDDTLSSFIQDKLALIPSELYLTLGSKFEHNDYTGVEVQPSIKTTWFPNDNQTIWGAISRAVRVPNRVMNHVSFITGISSSGFVFQQGNRTVDSERLIAYEAGFRQKIFDSFSVDITTFFNDYNKLNSNDAASATVVKAGNANKGNSHGVEIANKWTVTPSWDVGVNYTYLNMDLALSGASSVITEGKSPENQFTVSSNYAFTDTLSLHNYLYYLDQLRAYSLDSYTRIDSKLSWHPFTNLRIDGVVQNMFDDRHPEFSNFLYTTSSEVGRAYYGKVTVQF